MLFTIVKALMRTTPQKSIILKSSLKIFVKLLDIEIDNELLFQKKYCFIMQKSSPSNTRNMQTKNPMDKNEKVILKNC